MDNFKVKISGFGVDDQSALKNVYRMALYEVLYDDSLTYTDKFVPPGEQFNRLSFSKDNSVDKDTGNLIEPNIDSILEIPEVFINPDILSKLVELDAGQVKTKITAEVEINVEILRAFLIENAFLLCADGTSFPCEDSVNALVPFPAVRFASLTEDNTPENFKGFPLHPVPWAKPEQKKNNDTILIQPGVHCVIIDNRPGVAQGNGVLIQPNLFTNDPKKWWYKLKILEGEHKGVVGWSTIESQSNDLVILKFLTEDESNNWMAEQSQVIADDDPQPEVLRDAAGKRIPPQQKDRPSLSLNPKEYSENTTHVVRVPDDYDGLPHVNINGKAVIRTAPGVGKRLGVLDNNVPLEIVEPNVGKNCDWHKVRLNNTSPITALNLQTEGKIQNLDEHVYIYAPYTLILLGGKFINQQTEKQIEYINLPVVVPTPEETLKRSNTKPTGVDKLWIKESPCSPWIEEHQSATNKDYWKSAYKVVVQVDRPGIDKTVYSVWAERVAGAEETVDSEKQHKASIPPKDLNPTEISMEAVNVPRTALGETPEEQELTYQAGRSLGLLTLLKYYDKEYDLIQVLNMARLPYLVKVEGVHVDADIPNGPAKFVVSVPMRFFDAIPFRQVPFQFDFDSRLDEYLDEEILERKVVESLENLNELEKSLDDDGIGASIFRTFQGKDLNEEIQKVVNRIETNRIKALAVTNPRFEGQKIFFSSTFKVKRLEREIKSLKRAFKHYDRKIKNAKEKRSYLFPGFSAPLDLKREAEILDEWLGQLKEFLDLNDFAYKANMPSNRKDKGTPKDPSTKSVVEIGWNDKFEILYILFNGQHMRIGFNCVIENEPFSLKRTNAFIHRMPPIIKSRTSRRGRKKPPEEWVKQNVYPAALIIPSVIKPDENKEAEATIKKLNESSVKTNKDLEKQDLLLNDDKLHEKIAKDEKNKKQDNKDAAISPRHIAKAIKLIKTVDDTYDLVLDKIGSVQPLINEIAVCLTGDNFNLEEQIYNMILEPLFEEITGQEIDIESIEVSQDVVDAKDFLIDVFKLLSHDCLIQVLSSIVRFEDEVDSLPTEEMSKNIGGFAPGDFTDVSGDQIKGDFIVDGTISQNPPYLLLTDSPQSGNLIHKIQPPPNSQTVPFFQNPSYNAKIIQTLGANASIKLIGITVDGNFFEIELAEEGTKGFVPSNSITTDQPSALGFLKDGTQVNKLKDPDDPKKYHEESNFCKVEVVLALAASAEDKDNLWPDEEQSKALNGKQGWLPTAYLKAISEEAKDLENLSKVLLQQGSADKKQGLFNEVFIWQLFLITEEANGGVRDTLLSEIPIGTKKGEKLPKKYHKKNSWKYFGAKETKGKLFDSNTEKLTKAYFKKKSEGKIKDKDFVTNQDFAIAAEFFKNWNTKKFEKELSDIEEELSLPTPLTVLGNVTYPPPGFYTGKRSKCDWKYVAVVKAKTQFEIAKKKKNKGKIASLKKKLGKKQLAYQTCMKQKKDKVYGERRTFLSGGDPSAEQILRQDAYILNSANISDECDKLYKSLVEILGGTTWPGEADATPEQREAFEKWRICVSNTVKEKQKALQEAARKDALSSADGKTQEVSSTSELYTKENNQAGGGGDTETVYYPVPKTLDELVVQLTKWDDWPDNIVLIHDTGKETAAAFLSSLKSLSCAAIFDDLLDAMLEDIEENHPARAQIIRLTIDAVITLLETELNAPTFKPFTTPESPKFDVDNTGAEFSKLMKNSLGKVAKETILNVVTEILNLMKNYCVDVNNGDTSPKADPFDLFDADTINKLNDLANEYGLSNTLQGDDSPFNNSNFDFLLFLKNVMMGLSAEQKCSILVGELYRNDVIHYIQDRIQQLYPAYFNFFSKDENMVMLFNALSEIVDPDICVDSTLRTGVNNIPEDMGYFYGECPPDKNRGTQRDRLVRAGLTNEQAERQLTENASDKFRVLSQLQNLQDNMEDAINKNSTPPCERLNESMRSNKSVNRMLKQTLDTIFSPIEMMFNTEARQFIPALMDPSAFEVAMETPEISPDGTINPEAIAKLAQAGQDAAIKSSKTNQQSTAFANALKIKTVFKIEDLKESPNAAGEAVFLKDKDGNDLSYETEEKAKASPGFSNIPGIIKVVPAQVPVDGSFSGVSEDLATTVATELHDSLKSIDTIVKEDQGFVFKTPGMLLSNMVYDLTRTKTNSDSYSLKIKTFSKNQKGIVVVTPPITFKSTATLDNKTKNYMEQVDYLKQLNTVPEADSPQKAFFGHYLSTKFNSAFGSPLAGKAENLLTQMQSLAPLLYDTLSERALEKTLHIIGDSKYFNANELRKVNMTPTTTDLAKNCDASNILSIIDNSMINLTDLKHAAMDSFYDLSDVCNIQQDSGELGPVQESACDATLKMFIRVSIAENILNGFFAFTQYSPESIMKEKLMKSFLFKKFKDDLLGLGLYSKFKGRAKDIVDKRKNKGEYISAQAGKDCLRLLFEEQIKPINDKFKMFMKTNIKPAEIKFLDSLVTFDSAGRRPDFGDKINAVPPRFYNESGEFILNKKGDFFLESYIKIVDHYDEAGTPLLDAFIKNNDLLPLFTKNEYNQDGTRKDFLKGFVSLKDWTDFINSITVLAIQAKGEQKENLNTIYGSNLYEFFSQVTLGIRINYAFGPDDVASMSKGYRSVVDKIIDLLMEEAGVIPDGGVISFRNKEFVVSPGEAVIKSTHIIPFVAAELPIQDLAPAGNSFMMKNFLGSANGKPLIEQFNISKHVLIDRLIKTNEYSATMKYLFPINRYSTLSTLHTMTATKATLPSKDLFTTTKYLLKRSYDLHNAGNDKSYEDPWMKLSGGSAGSYDNAQRGGGEFDPFRSMILKLIAETPFLILKGVAEAADPNIQITKKIYDGINIAAKLLKEESFKGIKSDYEEATKDLSFSEKPSFEDWTSQNGITIPDVSVNLPSAIAPLISLLMLPSMVPYGVGFPPPYMFGPGIGPPMTPLAIPYLATGLISDDILANKNSSAFSPDGNQAQNPDCPSPFQDASVLLPPPEKDYDEDSETEEINED
tara:strand:- start:31669 stop:40695 length:9027 start_codon:yes stop_codon:yes gene_type:complete